MKILDRIGLALFFKLNAYNINNSVSNDIWLVKCRFSTSICSNGNK